jgi:hypothetical protein
MCSDRVERLLGLPISPKRQSVVATITPEQARAILEAQPAQRPVNQGHVDRLAWQMKSGRWRLTHEGLAFDERGMLFDGQHRLWAVFMSTTPAQFRIFLNEPRSNFDAIGAVVNVRRASDWLVIAGDLTDGTNANTISAALRFIWAYRRGWNPTNSGGNLSKEFGAQEQRDTLAVHPEVPALTSQYRARCSKIMPAAPFIALAAMILRADEPRAAIFLHQVMTGEGLAVGDPALTLRASAHQRRPGDRAPRVEMSYRFVRAWNAFREGRKLAKVFGSNTPQGPTARTGGTDVFPRIVGYDSNAMTATQPGGMP